MKNFLGYLLCGLFFLLLLWAFYPGLMSPDSLGNLSDGRLGQYSDLQAPVMSFVWRQLDQIVDGPALMFIMQNVIFWTAVAIFWTATEEKSPRLRICFVVFALLPQILSQLTTVWKDVGMGVTLLMASALIYYADRKRNKLAFFLAPLFLFYADAVRLNAFPAVLPLTIWGALVGCRLFGIKKTRLLPLAAGLICFAILSGAVYMVNKYLTGGKTVYPFQQVLLYDLAAISKEKDEPLFPDYVLHSDFSFDEVKANYNLRSVNALIYPHASSPDEREVLKLTRNADEIKALWGKWFETVRANPLIYVRHRWKIFAQLIGFTTVSVSNLYWDSGFSTSPPEYRREDNIAQTVLMKYFSTFRKVGFFHGFLWLLLLFFFFVKAAVNKLDGDWEIIFFLALSGILFTLAYFPTTPSTEFRYLFWTAVAAAIVTIFGTCSMFDKKIKRALLK